MAGRRTNLALLVLLAAVLATGTLAFAIGSGWSRWAVVAHGAAGLGILLLAPWKSAIAGRSLRRPVRRPGSVASLAFTVLVALALATGLLHGTGALRSAGGITAMQVHVTAAVASIPFAVWHVVARRVRPRRVDLSRRTLLRAGALGAASLAAYGGLAAVVSAVALPGRHRRFTGSYEAGSRRPQDMPITQWLDDVVQEIDGDTWRLVIRSRSGRREMTRAELDAMREPVTAVVDCTGGWFSEQAWEGVRLDRLLDGLEGARSVLARSATGYGRRYPASDAGRIWLATRAGGRPLSAGHGFPARVVAPGRRGFWWVKWVVALESGDTPWWWQPPFPLT